MTREEAQKALAEAGVAISVAVDILRPHVDLFERFLKEDRDADSVLVFIDPTLWASRERQITASILKGPFESALALINARNDASNAILKVRR